MKSKALPPINGHFSFFFFFATFFHILLILPKQGCAQEESNNVNSGHDQFPAFILSLNKETMTLPVLPNFDLQLDLKKKDITEASIKINKAIECLLWSDDLFYWVKFGGINDIPLGGPFLSADRLYCWNTKQMHSAAAVMVEDVHGNLELLQLKSQDTHLMTADWKRPLDIQRAVPFALGQDDCRFRSKKDISRSFGYDIKAGSIWPEPFLGAIDVFCFRY